MTVEECAEKLLGIADEAGNMARPDDLPEFMDVLRALVYGESVRAAGVVRLLGQERNLIGTGVLADTILATSPGAKR